MDELVKYGPLALVFLVASAILSRLAGRTTDAIWTAVVANKAKAKLYGFMAVILATTVFLSYTALTANRPASMADVGLAFIAGVWIALLASELPGVVIDRIISAIVQINRDLSEHQASLRDQQEMLRALLVHAKLPPRSDQQ